MAERQLPKLNVAGSIPVSRSTFAPKIWVFHKVICAGDGVKGFFCAGEILCQGGEGVKSLIAWDF